MSKMVHESLERTSEVLHYAERKCTSEMLQNFESLKKDFRNVNHGWDFIMDSRKNTHLDFHCVADELSLEHTPVSVLLMNCH